MRIRINRIIRIIRIIRPLTKKHGMQRVFSSNFPSFLYIHWLKCTSLIRIRIMPDGSNRIIRDFVKDLLFKTFFEFQSAVEYYIHYINPNGYLCPVHQRICSLVTRQDSRTVFHYADGRHQITIYKTPLFRETKLKLNDWLLIFLCYYIKVNITQCRFVTGVNRNTIAAFDSIAYSALSS